MTSTLFDARAYDAGIRDAMDKVIADWGFRYPGIADVEHVYFYNAASAPPETIRDYLDRSTTSDATSSGPHRTSARPPDRRRYDAAGGGSEDAGPAIGQAAE